MSANGAVDAIIEAKHKGKGQDKIRSCCVQRKNYMTSTVSEVGACRQYRVLMVRILSEGRRNKGDDREDPQADDRSSGTPGMSKQFALWHDDAGESMEADESTGVRTYRLE